MSAVLYDVQESIALITLNRPDQRNAIDDALATGLADALHAAGDNDDVRAVVVTGAGKGFCSGADLAGFAQIESPREVRDYLVRVYRPMIELFVSVEKPIIGAINGYAAGAGASIALACDLRVMADDAKLLQAFVNLGLVPDAGATWFLARQIGYSRAFEVAIEGKPLTADRCLELGLANRVVPADELRDHALEWAGELAQGPTIALGLTKRLMHRAMEHSLDEMIEYEAALQQGAIASEDHAEGVAAFLEKRDPEFNGR